MPEYRLRYLGDPVLKVPAEPVSGLPSLPLGLIPDMHQVLRKHRGYGIAAQQVGATCRVALCDFSGNESPDPRDLVVAINLEVVERSPETFIHTREGCLSVQSQAGKLFRTSVRRHEWVRVRYRDEDWQLHELRLEGLAAIVAQHEADHLDGRCIVDGLPRQQRRQAERIVGRCS